MPAWLDVFFEILKFTIPALIMFWAVQNLFQQFLEGQQRLRLLEIKKGQKNSALPLRLQAYERLSLFCERISVPNLIRRLKTEGMQAGALRIALMMAIQQEFEHNVTQQVYISEQLWEIIKIARTDSVNLVSLVAEGVDPKAGADELVKALFKVLEERGEAPLDTALAAIRKEAGLLFG